MDKLTGIVAFVRTADLGSFVAAGRVLEVSASAVGKAVARLEHELGVRLLQRSTRRVSLTEEGRLFHERCRRILDDLDDARAMLSQTLERPRGRLRVTAPIVSYHLLLPLLPEFLARYPAVELDLDFNDRIVDLIEEGIDVAIRSGVLPDSRLVSRPLWPYRMLLCASPAYLSRRGQPANAADLAVHDGICFRYPNSGKLLEWPAGARGAEGDATPTLQRSLVFNNMEAVRGAALRGLGIGCMPDFLVREPLADGALSRVLDDDVQSRSAGRYHGVWATSRHLSPKVRVFVDFLVEHARDGAPQEPASSLNVPTAATSRPA